jgi:host factor-I protein
MSNRKLIRPNLSEIKSQMQSQTRGAKKRQSPPEQTNAEVFYYLKQMSSKTTMVIVMTDGDVLEGVIEWYDRHCIKINRINAPNLLVPKRNIKYMYKRDEKKDENSA